MLLPAVERLIAGIEQMKQRVAQANAETVRKVRAGTKAVFENLVPSLELDITCDEPETLGENGAQFAVRSATGGGTWRSGLSELSGGQRTLLNLALLLSIAQHRARPSMLLCMDEVDAALDESNAARVAALLKQIAKQSQVIAISHRAEFQRAADHLVRLAKSADGHTVVVAGRS